MKIANIGYDMGANATIKAQSKCPELFTQTACIFAVQPYNVSSFASKLCEAMGAKDVKHSDIDARLKNKSGFSLFDMSPDCFIKDLKVPIMYS